MSSFRFKENYEIKIWHWRFQCFITVLSHFCVVLNSGFEFMCQSIFCSVLFRPSDPVPQTHTGGDVAASTLLVSVAGRSMNRLWHKMAAVGSMCTEAAQVQLASVCRYQRRQAEELLSPGPTGWTSRSRSYFPPLSLETLSLSLSLNVSPSPYLSLTSPAQLQLCLHPCSQGNLLFPTGLFVPLLRWHPSYREGGVSLFYFFAVPATRGTYYALPCAYAY